MTVETAYFETHPTVVTPEAKATPTWKTFDFIPVGLFGSVMGLVGLSSAWRLAHARFETPEWIAEVIGICALIAFVALVVGYGLKVLTAFAAVKTELGHPIAGNLFGTIAISFLLIPIVVAPTSLVVAQVLWIIGAITMAAFAWFIVSRWLSNRQQAAHATPAWLIPLLGMLDIPLALPVLGLHSMHGVMVASLAIGLFFAVPLFTMIFSRLLFETTLPDALQPSLLLLVAPFAVGVSTYATTVGGVDIFAESLYALTLFTLAVVVPKLRHLLACCPFRISWWGVSFPLAASAIAAMRVATAEHALATDAIAIAVIALATIVIVGLLVRTLVGLVRGELRTLSS